MKKLTVLLGILLSVSFAQAETVNNQVYTWKSGHMEVFSDVPHNLSTQGVSTINIRTLTVKAINDSDKKKDDYSGLTLAQKQAKLNEEIAEKNKEIAEENKKQEEEIKKANCKTARLNLQNAQNAPRLPDKQKVVANYQANVAKYCN